MSSNQEVMVTVLCLTYNHMAYIKQCLDGFLMQDTSFKFEVIVHDDASTDGTTEILKEYVLKYPDIIRPIIETENQYTKVGFSGLFLQMSRKSNGKYIALCEGDDYWTDPYKLQKQVDFLESHPDYVMCSHKWNEFIENEKKINWGIPFEVNSIGKIYDLNCLIHGEWYFQPLTILYRRSSVNFERYNRYKNSKDITLLYALLKNGKGFCIPDVMATYRIHSSGMWSGSDLNSRRKQDFETKLGIYEIEKSKESATFILHEFTKLMSRIWMLKKMKLFWKVGTLIAKHFGYLFTLRLFVNKLFFNKTLQWNTNNL